MAPSGWVTPLPLTSSVVSQLIETPEAKPFWCDIEEIPFADMWPDDQTLVAHHFAAALRSLLAVSWQIAGHGNIWRKYQPLVGDFLFENERLLEHRIYTDKSFSVALDTVLDNT